MTLSLKNLLQTHHFIPLLFVVVRVGFKQDQYTYNESDGNATVEVFLEGETALDVTVLIQGGML